MAGRLRTRTEFGKRAVASESQDTKTVYLISIASEGKTEEQYFDGIRDSNFSDVIKIDRLVRKEDTDTKSHPDHVIDLLDERKEYWQEHGIESDELWMVVDRDRQNISDDQLNKIIDKCSKEGYNLALSNPTFEFWLLLHISDIGSYDNHILIANPKPRTKSKKRFIDKELSNLLGGYNKKNIQFERFESGISDAIKRAKELPVDNVVLKDELGTSVCLLVDKLTPYRE